MLVYWHTKRFIKSLLQPPIILLELQSTIYRQSLHTLSELIRSRG